MRVAETLGSLPAARLPDSDFAAGPFSGPLGDPSPIESDAGNRVWTEPVAAESEATGVDSCTACALSAVRASTLGDAADPPPGPSGTLSPDGIALASLRVIADEAGVVVAPVTSELTAACTHAVLSDIDTLTGLFRAGMDEFISTNTINNEFGSVDVSGILAEKLKEIA